MSDTPATDGPVKFVLHRPIEFRGTQFAEFIAREPKMRDLRKFVKDVDLDAILAMEKLLADLCGVDHPVMGELSPKDFGKMKKWVSSFLEDMLNESEM